jgi:Tol biopolymer transport system component
MRPEDVRTELERILSSATFSEAERSRKFLRFVVEGALANRSDDIKESVIGVEAFGRPATFDPRSDPIVRVEAGRLRGRLLAYYHAEGAHDTVSIELPKGTYVPVFKARPAPGPGRPSESPQRRALWAGVLIAAVLLLGSLWHWNWTQTAPARQFIELAAPAPDGVELQSSAVSPDGRYVAFTGRSGTVTRLWLRALQSMSAQPLDGTEGAALPFWSPDSRTIAFFTSSALMRIDLGGGPARAICRVQAAFGGTWGPSGIILFSQRPPEAIFQVPSDGGAPSAVTEPNHGAGEVAHVFPAFLPDGQHFLYSIVRRAPGRSVLCLGALHSRGCKALVAADPGAAYSPPYAGEAAAILFGYRGALMLQTFDEKRLALTGAAVQIAPEVRHVHTRTDVSAATNGVIVFNAAGEARRELTWFDRAGRILGTEGARNNYQSIQLSPDGRKLAVQAPDGASGRSEVWIVDLERKSTLRLGEGTEEGFAPVWSPNGTEVLFSAILESRMMLVRQKAEELQPRPWLDLQGVALATDWSIDGRFVSYTKFQPGPEMGVIALASSSKTAPPLPANAGLECCGVFSPDGPKDGPRWTAYTSDESGRNEVYIRPFGTSGKRWQVSNSGGWLPHWGSGGKVLYYLALDGTLMAAAITPTTGGISAGKPTGLFRTNVPPFQYPTLPGNSYAVTGDGRFLVNTVPEALRNESLTVFLPRPLTH